MSRSFVTSECPIPFLEATRALPPTLPVEVLSPDDRPGEVLEKVADYLNAGTHLVWIIDPDRRQARIHRANGTVTVIGESDVLDGEDVLHGFSCTLSEVL